MPQEVLDVGINSNREILTSGEILTSDHGMGKHTHDYGVLALSVGCWVFRRLANHGVDRPVMPCSSVSAFSFVARNHGLKVRDKHRVCVEKTMINLKRTVHRYPGNVSYAIHRGVKVSSRS